MSLQFKNAYLIHEGIRGNFYVEQGRVTTKATESKENQIIDLEGRIVIRGFADPHMHLDKALIGDVVANQSGTLFEAIDIMSRYKGTMSDEDIEHRMRQVIEWAYANGTRFLRTNIDIDENIKLRSLAVLQKLQKEYQGKLIIETVAFPQEGFVSNPNNLYYLQEALKQGANVLGGIPAFDKDPLQHLEQLMVLAKKYNVDLDAHIDETDDPSSLTLSALARLTITHHYQGRVTAAHCCSLAANDPEIVKEVLDDVKKANINIVSLPSTNLYLQGRDDLKNVRRGITPIKRMVNEFGINVAIGSDNVRDPFNCFGNANPLQSALIAAHGAQMGAMKDFANLFDMVSKNGMTLMHQDYHLEGSEFFIVLDAKTPQEAIIGLSKLYGVYEHGIFSKR